MNPEWVIVTIRAALVVRVDFVRPVGGEHEFVHVEIFGGFEDDDGWDVSHLKLTVIEHQDVEKFEYAGLCLPKIEVGHDFVRERTARWHSAWLAEKRHIVGEAVVANGEELVRWEKISSHEQRVLDLLKQVLAHLLLRKAERHVRSEVDSLRGTIARLERLISEKERHRDSFRSQD